jgi:predicted nuclease with RNAse H fold
MDESWAVSYPAAFATSAAAADAVITGAAAKLYDKGCGET